MLSKETKITFTAQAAKYQKPMSGKAKKTGEDYEIREAIIITDMMQDGFKFKAVEIHIQSENDMSKLDVESIQGKTYSGIKAKGTNTFYVQLEDIKL